MSNTITIHQGTHNPLMRQVIKKVEQLDEVGLKELEAWLAHAPAAEETPLREEKTGMTRRRAIFMTLLGGAALTGSGATGYVGGQRQAWGTANVELATQTEQIEALRQELDALEGRVASQRELIVLYDELDQVELDNTVSSGMQAVVGSIGNTAEHAQRLRDGLLVAKENINQLDQGLAILDEGLVRVEGMITGLSALMQGLEDRLEAAGEPVAPITDALGSLFTNIISYIPFGVGERIQASIDGIQEVIASIPESIASLNDSLITPLRTTFFPRDGDNIQVRLLEPLTNVLFSPAEWTLSGLANLADTWDEELEQPAQEMIKKRATLRQQIARHKEQEEL